MSAPRPRILVGGAGERKTLRLVAQYADACNFFGTPEEITHKLTVLRGHCETIGRDPNEIEVTALFRGGAEGLGDDDLLRLAEGYAAVGVATLVAGPEGADPAGALEQRWTGVMDRLAEIEPSSF